MGASITVDQKARALEKTILAESGLVLDKDIQITDIQIDYLGVNYIHTIKCGDQNEQVLVLIHGYGGTGVLFYKMLKELSKVYKVYCIDLLGMGLSSRPEFECETTDQAISFFVDSLEQWRISIGLENFILGGHSFGGYMAFQYASKFPEYIQSLLLLSPLGFTKRNIEFQLDNEDYLNKLGFFQRQFQKMRIKFWKERLTPSILANKYGWIFGFIIRRAFTKRMRVTSDVGQYIYDFIMETFKLPISSEKAIHLIINPNIVAYQPLEDLVNKFDTPTLVLYGDSDWMDDSGARRVYRSEKKNFEVRYLYDCGHQVTMENPIELTEHIINSNIFAPKYNEEKQNEIVSLELIPCLDS